MASIENILNSYDYKYGRNVNSLIYGVGDIIITKVIPFIGEAGSVVFFKSENHYESLNFLLFAESIRIVGYFHHKYNLKIK